MSKRNQNIEALRGIAILMVLIFHFCYRYFEIYGLEQLLWNNQYIYIIVKNFGTLGVGIFLVITGLYLINTNSVSIFTFLSKRILNLWPTYFFCIVTTFLALQIWPLEGRTVTLFEFLLNVPFLNGFIGIAYVDTAHWYLTTIIAIYFMTALIHKLKIQEKCYPYYIWLVMNFVLFHIKEIDCTMPYVNKIANGLFLVTGGSRIGFVIVGIVVITCYCYFTYSCL